ncbi:unnamed protein product [Owenia fusiformis]|uniref:Cilia- and flagella-associated protein 74 n=1 Tax=Owenia fusiformis TaxID=6347 RepID=A0A8J1UDD9_OWEFU|nr:unnamed protein product [Owenia fusiformis]
MEVTEEPEQFTPTNDSMETYQDDNTPGWTKSNIEGDVNFDTPGTEEGMYDDIPEDADGIFSYDSDPNDNLADSGSDCEVCNNNIDGDHPKTPDQKFTRQEQLRMMHLRKYLDQLTEKVLKKDYAVQKTRDELKKCRERIQELEEERDTVFQDMQNSESEENTSAVYRLRSQFDRVIKELDSEQDLEEKIKATLETEEYELSQAQVEQGKFLLEDDTLQKQEVHWERERTDMAMQRNKKETAFAVQAEKKKKSREREHQAALRERERRHRHAINEARKSKERANKFLKETMSRIRQRDNEEEERQKQDMDQRMKTLLSLKQNISSNRENLKAIQARDKALERQGERELQAEAERVRAEGGNPQEVLIKHKRNIELEKEKQFFDTAQRERQVEIASKILREEQRMKKRKEQQPQLWNDPRREKTKRVAPHKKKKLQIFQESGSSSLEYSADAEEEGRSAPDEIDAPSSDEGENRQSTFDRTSRAEIQDSDDSDGGGMEDNINLAKPEFEGMWDQHKPYTVPKDIDGQGDQFTGLSKMEKDIMSRQFEKQKASVVTKQVAGGKEFKGVAFYSKPDVIHFKDFDVGKTYKKKVILTNVSYTVNYCKLLGITEHLKDFIEIVFDPPGQMSAGLTCEMLVTFKPMINEDLEGTVDFLAQTGPFAIPLVCTTKKCDLSVDTNLVDFGTTVIGETMKQTITLTNNGALTTGFEFIKLTGMKPRTLTSAATSLGRLTTAETSEGEPEEQPPKSQGKGSKKKLETKKKREDEEDEKVPENLSQALPTTIPSENQTQAASLMTDNRELTGSKDTLTTEVTTSKFQSMESLTSTGIEAAAAAVPELPRVDEIPSALERPVTEEDEYATLDGMKIGKLFSGEVKPFSSVKLEIIWQPLVPQASKVDFLITFTDQESDDIPIQAVSNAIDVPVWVERQNVDLKICMFDRLYQDTIVVNNRATTALKLTFEVCKELRNHLELLPKTGYIQAQSQFSAQLKFWPRHSLFEDGGKYFDKETGVLEAPMTIRVAGQTRPVPFVVHAVVTNTDLQFDTTDIDFGHSTIYESVKHTVKLTNHSILAQQFGFVGLPQYVDVQPNDGFGTLLPLETIELDIIFSPSKARDYNFELTCKSLINREFKIQCKGVGVHPPLELSQQVVHFKATALNDVSTTSLHVINSHTSMNEFTHPVPRIGKGEIAPVGPTSYEFMIPDGAPLTISPSVGTIEPGQKHRIQIRFSPKLQKGDIKKETVRMQTKAAENQARKEYDLQMKREKAAAAEANNAKGGKKDGKKDKGKASPVKTPKQGVVHRNENGMNLGMAGPKPVSVQDEEAIDPNSDGYASAHGSLLRTWKPHFKTFVIPCYVASGKCANPGELPYSVHDTLYLEVHCPIVKPDLVVISDSGRTTTDYGSVSIGQTVNKSITIQNISNKTLDLASSVLNTSGPFLMLNSLRMLPPDETHTIIISFVPTSGQTFYEVLEIQAPESTLFITLMGKGISPIVNLSISNNELDMGHILEKEYCEQTFKIENTSTLSIEYCIKLDSNSLLRHSRAQALPQFIKVKDKKSMSLVGTQNNNGQSVFDCVPASGTIPGGGKTEIVVTFAPDHSSEHYSDGARIELFQQEEAHVFQIKGVAKPHIMYVTGGDPLTPDIESLAVLPVTDHDDEDSKVMPQCVLVNVFSISRDQAFEPGEAEFLIGCVRTMAVSQKKNGEFQFENTKEIELKGFTIDPVKGQVEAGQQKPIKVTWTPTQGYDPNNPAEANILVTVRGDIVEQYNIMLRGYASSG